VIPWNRDVILVFAARSLTFLWMLWVLWQAECEVVCKRCVGWQIIPMIHIGFTIIGIWGKGCVRTG
jgi:hypothetical protein